VFDALVLWLHLLAAVVFIGPQVFLAAIAMPAVRSMADAQARQQITRQITRGFGMLGGVALVVLLITGIWNFYDARDADLFDFQRYFVILQIKLTLVTLVIILTVLHGAVLGRRLLQLQEQGAPEEEIARMRQWSMFASIGNLVLSIAILLCAALLGSEWSKLGDLR
jgi:uncharacterized membrane protein